MVVNKIEIKNHKLLIVIFEKYGHIYLPKESKVCKSTNSV